MSKKNDDKKVVSVRFTEEEKEKLKQCSALCGLSQTEFIRQLCKGKTPKPQPSKEFWKLLGGIYEVHAGFEKCIPYFPEAAEKCREIEAFILKLQEATTGSPESQRLYGEKEHPRSDKSFDTCGESDERSVM